MSKHVGNATEVSPLMRISVRKIYGRAGAKEKAKKNKQLDRHVPSPVSHKRTPRGWATLQSRSIR